MAEQIDLRARWREDLKAWGKKMQKVWDERVYEMLTEPPRPEGPLPFLGEEEQKKKAMRKYARAFLHTLSSPLSDFIVQVSGPPGSNKPIFVEPEDREAIRSAMMRPGKFQVFMEKKQEEEQTLQAIHNAQQYIKDYEQWIRDHPKKTPPQEMTDRYKQEQLFVAKNFRL